MEAQVKGTVLPVLEMVLNPGETLVAEAGELSWMTQPIQLKTTTQTGGGKGMFGVLKRAVGGGGIFMTEYSADGGPGMVAFATKLPGQILPIQVKEGAGFLVHRHGFLCATEGIEVTMGFQKKLGAGIFGGEGFVLQKLSGNADAWIELDGEVMIYDLQPGQVLRVHPWARGDVPGERAVRDHDGAGDQEQAVRRGRAVPAKLTGPGRVWLQTLPLANLAHALSPYMVEGETASGGSAGAVAGALGGLLGGG